MGEQATVQMPGCLPPGKDEWSQLDQHEAAIWLDVGEETFMKRLNRNEIPHLRLGLQIIRIIPHAVMEYTLAKSLQSK